MSQTRRGIAKPVNRTDRAVHLKAVAVACSQASRNCRPCSMPSGMAKAIGGDGQRGWRGASADVCGLGGFLRDRRWSTECGRSAAPPSSRRGSRHCHATRTSASICSLGQVGHCRATTAPGHWGRSRRWQGRVGCAVGPDRPVRGIRSVRVIRHHSDAFAGTSRVAAPDASLIRQMPVPVNQGLVAGICFPQDIWC
jgi:hypothetical protein